jgi:hypothetical protein
MNVELAGKALDSGGRERDHRGFESYCVAFGYGAVENGYEEEWRVGVGNCKSHGEQRGIMRGAGHYYGKSMQMVAKRVPQSIQCAYTAQSTETLRAFVLQYS